MPNSAFERVLASASSFKPVVGAEVALGWPRFTLPICYTERMKRDFSNAPNIRVRGVEARRLYAVLSRFHPIKTRFAVVARIRENEAGIIVEVTGSGGSCELILNCGGRTVLKGSWKVGAETERLVITHWPGGDAVMTVQTTRCEGKEQGRIRRWRLRSAADAERVARTIKQVLGDVAPLIRPYVG